MKILTTGIYWIFRGLKFEPDAEIGQKGTLCKGLILSALPLCAADKLLKTRLTGQKDLKLSGKRNRYEAVRL